MHPSASLLHEHDSLCHHMEGHCRCVIRSKKYLDTTVDATQRDESADYPRLDRLQVLEVRGGDVSELE